MTFLADAWSALYLYVGLIKMKSIHADTFNHDAYADEYDADVLNESDPIRAGYHQVLDWVIKFAEITDDSRVLELGSGTGNLTERIRDCGDIICVDVSERMEELASEKVAHLSKRRFIMEDVLAVFDRDLGGFDAIVSTYTIHHLTEEEKYLFFQKVWMALNDGGVAVFGDLMVENAKARGDKIAEYQNKGNTSVVEALNEEFFWHLEESIEHLQQLGFKIKRERFSDLSFGIAAYKKPTDLVQ